MNKTIPYEKILIDSRATGVEKELLIKRYLNYRKYTPGNDLGICRYCKASDTPTISGEKINQCHIIGIGNNFYCKIDLGFTCDFFKESQYKIKLKEKSECQNTLRDKPN